VRLGTSAIGNDEYPRGLFPPLIITRGAESEFHVLEAACTHEGCTVPTFDSAQQRIECPCHGSRYSIDGQVLRGPANFPLRRFSTQTRDGVLLVQLPDTSFSLTALEIDKTTRRLRLEFIAFEHILYEVRYQRRLDVDWSGPVPFALSATAPLDQTVVVGRAQFASIYVETPGETGFFGVAMRVSEV
jgi:nitrite reductase/ring-hydroxylating ferredoxin subunit